MNYDEFTKLYDENYYTTIGFRYKNINDKKQVENIIKKIDIIAEENELNFNDINKNHPFILYIL